MAEPGVVSQRELDKPSMNFPTSTSDRYKVWIAQGFGVGRLRYAPGTWGSLLGVAWTLLLLCSQSLWIYTIVTVLGLFLSVQICGAAEKILNTSDPSSVVLDEISAFPICLMPLALWNLAHGFGFSGVFGWIGAWLEPIGIKVAFTPLGIFVALTFIGLPFVVRTVQPVLEDLEPEFEEAAASLGATRAQAFRRVVLPALWPSLLTGFALAFARAVGEYGSVVFISGNMPFRTEIAPVLIVQKLEEFAYAEATAIATVLLAGSILTLGLISWLEGRNRRYAP